MRGRRGTGLAPEMQRALGLVELFRWQLFDATPDRSSY